ncbi:MAG TPA: choice-of-anchor C family protein [Caulobacteraceae bacterium]|nr:choice-of-anchor C family protein [Caulobacteraceae bacterium]
MSILAAASSVNAATIVNGGFESSTLTPAEAAQMSSQGFATLGAGNTDLTGWSIGGAGIDYIGSYWMPAGGTHSIDLNALSAGSIFQSVATVIGQAYQVSFDLAGNPDGAPIVKLAIADATGLPGAAYLFDTTGKTKTNMGWTTFTYDFTADSTATTLTFSNSNQSGFKTPFGAALDNISISAVPEPASWALMLIGFGTLGMAMRSRRSRGAVIA